MVFPNFPVNPDGGDVEIEIRSTTAHPIGGKLMICEMEGDDCLGLADGGTCEGVGSDDGYTMTWVVRPDTPSCFKLYPEAASPPNDGATESAYALTVRQDDEICGTAADHTTAKSGNIWVFPARLIFLVARGGQA